MSMKDIIGDFQAFFALQLGRLNDVDIDDLAQFPELETTLEPCSSPLQQR